MKKKVSAMISCVIFIVLCLSVDIIQSVNTDTNEIQIDIPGYSIYANGRDLLIRSDGFATYGYYDYGEVGVFDTEDEILMYHGSPLDINSYYIYAGGESATTNETRITMLSGEVAMIYGGGKLESAKVLSDTMIQIKGGVIKNSIYGGGYSASVEKNSTIIITGGSIAGNVYGGGHTTHASINGSTTINISNASIDNNVYGGGYDGTSLNTNVTISENSEVAYVYGGGYSKTATVNNDTIVNQTGGVISENIFGGGHYATTQGNARINLSSGSVLNVYGGGHIKDATVKKNTFISVSNTAKVENVLYGSGAASPVEGNANISISGGQVAIVRGGGSSWQGITYGAATTNNVNIKITGGEITTLFAGGNDASAQVFGNTNVTIGGTAHISGNVYGGGINAPVNGNTSIIITNGAIDGSIFGGGSNASVDGNTSITITDANIKGSIYGGGSATTAIVEKNTSILIAGTSFIENRIYGGGYNALVKGDTLVAMTGGTVNSSIFGGGRISSVNGSTSINIRNGHVKGSIYGGGSTNTATVANNTTVLINGTSTIETNVYGGGLGTLNITGDAIVKKNTEVTISEEAQIVGSVYGGGYYAIVEGNTQVNIAGGMVGGNVFGTGYEAGANNSSLHISGGTIVNTVYASSSADDVMTSTLTISGGVMKGDVYGGAGGNSNTDTTITTISGNAEIEGSFYGAAYNNNANKVQVSMNGGIIHENLYGGSSHAGLVEETDVILSGGTIHGLVYAGSRQSTVKNSSLTINGDIQVGKKGTNSIFAGGEAGTIIETTNLIIKSGDISSSGNIYAGGNLSSAITNIINVTITGGTLPDTIFGAGNAAKTNAVNFTISGDPILKNVYLGGNTINSTVNENVSFLMESGLIEGNLYGAGKFGTVISAIDMKILGGTILGDVSAYSELSTVAATRTLSIGNDVVIGTRSDDEVITGILLNTLTTKTVSISDNLVNGADVNVKTIPFSAVNTIIATNAIASDLYKIHVIHPSLETIYKDSTNELVLADKTASIRGQITNTSNETIMNATVNLYRNNVLIDTTTTGDNGNYYFNLGNDNGNYIIESYATGYDRHTISTTVTSLKDVLNQNIQLSTFVAVEEVILSKDLIYVGNTLDLEVISQINPNHSTYSNIVWSIESAETQARLDGNLLTATSIGEIVIRATIIDGLAIGSNFTTTFTITANQFIPVIDVILNQNTLYEDHTLNLNAKSVINPINSTKNEKNWEIIDASTTGATLDNGILSASDEGDIYIKVTIIDGVALGSNYTKTFKVTVNDFTPITSITMNNELSVLESYPLLLDTTINPISATNQNIVWSIVESNDTGAAIIDGVLKAPRQGSVKIAATVIDGTAIDSPYIQTFDIEITNFIPVEDYTLANNQVFQENPLLLTGSVSPITATNQMTQWSIIDAGNTDITLNGNTIQAANAGEAIIQLKIENGLGYGMDYKKEFTINILEFIPVLDIEMTNELSVYEGFTLPITSVLSPTDASFNTIEWSLETTSHASFDGHTLTGLSPGNITLTATVENGQKLGTPFTKSFTIEIKEFIKVVDFQLDRDEVYTNFDLPLTGTINPISATNQDMQWRIIDEGETDAIITDGVLYSTKPGTVKIQGVIKNGLGNGVDFEKEFTITVIQFVPVTDMEMTNETTVVEGMDVQLTSNVFPSDATFKDVVWNVKSGEATIVDNTLHTNTAGEIVLTATILNGLGYGMDYKKEFTINILEFIPVLDIEMTNELSVYEGFTLPITSVLSPTDASFNTIEWSLETTSHASFDGHTLTGLSPGNITLTATVENGQKLGTPFTKSFTIEIKEFIKVVDFQLDRDEVYTNFDLPLTGTINPISATNQDMQWRIIDEGETDAIITDGVLYSTKPGTVKIQGVIKNGLGNGVDFEKEFTITVIQFVPVTDMEMTNETTVVEGMDVQLTSNVFPSDATFKDVVWNVKSGEATIVDNTLHTNTAGEIVLTATILNGLGNGKDFIIDYSLRVIQAPKIIFGDGQTVMPGSHAIFITNILLDDYLNVKINGELVDTKFLQFVGEPTSIYISKDYLLSLFPGTYSIELHSPYGVALGTFTLLPEAVYSEQSSQSTVDKTTNDGSQTDLQGNDDEIDNSEQNNDNEQIHNDGEDEKKYFWSILNLLITIFIVLFALLNNITKFNKSIQKNADDKYRSLLLVRSLSLTSFAVIAFIVLAITQNYSGTMIVYDKWTLPFVVIMFLEIACTILFNKKIRLLNHALDYK